jgi:hypothetical protein
MGLFSLIFGSKRRVRIGNAVSDDFLPIGAVQLDASLNETHSGSVDVTQHPVEEGADITDHVRIKPETLSITGIVSNTPLIFLASLRESPTRAEEAYEKLRDILRTREPISVITTLRQYENMVLTSMQTNRDASTGNVVNVTLNFQEIIIASSETVAAPEPAAGTPSSAGATNAGKQGTATAASPGPPTSALKSLSGSF